MGPYVRKLSHNTFPLENSTSSRFYPSLRLVTYAFLDNIFRHEISTLYLSSAQASYIEKLLYVSLLHPHA